MLTVRLMQRPLFSLPTPSMPKLDLSRCHTKPISYETAANTVQEYHYAHRVPTIDFAIGMFVDNVLAGCLTYGRPAGANVQASICGPDYANLVLELNRLVIHDWAGRNSESWLIGQSFKYLDKPAILLSYSDTGEGHIGYIYQATNWLYTGLSWAADIYHLDDGSIVKTRRHIERKGKIIKTEKAARKHRYVYFLGSKRQRREFRYALRWPVLPYPKALNDS